MKWGGRLLNITLFIFIIIYVFIGMSYGRTPRMFPLIVGVPMLLLTGFQTVIDFFPNLSKKYSQLGTIDAEMISGRAKDEVKEEDPRRIQKELESFIWLGVAVMLIMLVGIFIGVPLFIFVFLKLRYSRGWTLSLGLPLGTLLTMYILFMKVLNVQFYRGIFFAE